MGNSTVLWQLADLYMKEEEIRCLTPIAEADFNQTCAPLFAEPALVTREPAAKYAALSSYFRVRQEASGLWLTDGFHENECFHNRLFMLVTAWRRLLEAPLQGLSLLDVAGSSGYYCFHALRLGFREAVCLEGRPEYGEQLALIAEKLGVAPRFIEANVEVPAVLHRRRYDVVLAQGILHHIYGHLAFLKGLYRATSKLMILDTHLNARMDATADMWVENPANVRDSPFSGVSLCPSLTVLVTLLKQVGFRTIYRVPYARRVRDEDGNVIDPYRYRSLRRIMLACLP